LVFGSLEAEEYSFKNRIKNVFLIG
jgi:hypothetical protein